MDIREVLQAAADIVIRGDHIATMVLADMLEEADMEDQAKQVRTGKGILPTYIMFEVEEGVFKDKYECTIYLRQLVDRMVHDAYNNGNRTCRRMNGLLYANKKHRIKRERKRGKHELDLNSI